MLAIDTTNPEIGIISSNSSGELVISEFSDGKELTGCEEIEDKATASESLASLVSVSWQVAGIIWRDNCDLPVGKFSIQSTLM